MATLQTGQSVTLQVTEGESWTVTPTLQAQISSRGVSGGPLTAPATISAATTYGPFNESGTLTITALRGSCDYAGSELSSLVSGAVKLALGMLGQSNERGQVDFTEAIGGTLSRTAYPQAFRSIRNPQLRAPIYPAQAKYGGPLLKMSDDLAAGGWPAHIVNSSIGSLSMIRDAAGQVQTRANATAYRQRRASEGPGDPGYAGDVMVVQGRVFLCTVGVKAYCSSNGNGIDLGGPAEIDYLRTVGTQVTAGAEPAGLATANVGDVIADGTVSWTCMSTSTTWNGVSYGAGNILTETRYGFDPFGLLHRLREMLSNVPAQVRCVLLQNAQSDTGNANLTYQQALEGIGGFFLQRGIKVAVGLSCYQPSAGTTAYNNLTTRVNNALTNLRASAGTYYDVADVITGPNLYTLMGSTGAMAAGGAYFVKDSGQDDLHLNARGAIAAGGFNAAALLAGLAAFA